MRVNSISPETGFPRGVAGSPNQADAGVAELTKNILQGADHSGPAVANPPPSVEPRQKFTPNLDGLRWGLQISVDAATKRIVVTVYDLDTGETIRQIPPEEVLAFMQQLQQTKGIFVSRVL